MKRITFTTALALMMFIPSGSSALAADSDVERLQQEMEKIIKQNQLLTSKITQMETEMQALKNAEQQQAETSEADGGKEGSDSMITKYISLGGAIEVEMGWSEDFDGGEESDISLATAEIGLEAQLTEWGLGVIALEWDDEEDKITVDEAFINIGNTEKYPVYTQVGRYVTPFGLFAGNTISDPLTKEVFETKEDALLVGAEMAGFNGSVFFFNGDTNDGGDDDHISQWGVNVGYSLEKENYSVATGIGYVSSVFDADGLTDTISEIQEEADDMGAGYDPDANFLNADDVGGVAINASVRVADYVFLAEYITAVEEYETTYSILNQPTRLETQPSAYHFEAGYNFAIREHATVFSLAYSGTNDLLGYLPKSRFAANLGIEIFEGLSFGLEFTHDEDYEISDGGTGDSANGFLTQLAYEF